VTHVVVHGEGDGGIARDPAHGLDAEESAPLQITGKV
jgi:hypothetical protein